MTGVVGMNPSKPIYVMPTTGVIATALAEKVPGESLLATLERKALLEVLAITKGSQKDAAGILGISCRTINYKLSAYKLRPCDRFRAAEASSISTTAVCNSARPICPRTRKNNQLGG